MGLAKSGDELFGNPLLTDWVRYVDDLKEVNPTAKTSAIPTLIRQYGDDHLFELIEAATKISSTTEVAIKLRGKQLEYWAAIGKAPEDIFFHNFMLARAGENIFTNPDFAAWTKYVDDFNLKNPQKATSPIPILMKYYADGRVPEMIVLAKKAETTKAIATKMDAAQMNYWLNSGKSAGDVFTLLKLDKAEDNFFKNPLYETWTTYLQLFNKQNPEQKTDLFTTLREQYRSKPFLKILEQAKAYPSWEATATELQAKKIQEYLSRKVSPSEVFYQLGLEESKNVFTNPLFNTWLTYLNTFNKQNPKKREFLYMTLERHLNNNLGAMLREAMKTPSTQKIVRAMQDSRMTLWLRRESIPQSVFKWLGLQTQGDGLVANPFFEFFSKYMDKFNQRYPQKKTAVIDIMSAYYTDNSLFQILEKAKQVSSTKKTATTLQLALLNKLVRAKRTPEDVAKMLNVELTGPLMKTYALKFTRAWGNNA
ncbi:Avirulence (Avh) protein [Phytophthora cinnamomi]|uniref:Avirulence (Avh) protein n=1 Tax=Phytophthora cinnamomi TaxID=4785 RepID=UPI0035598A77|nr:Avirulence (Avh) protein [Phytophthora cinnamomi]